MGDFDKKNIQSDKHKRLQKSYKSHNIETLARIGKHLAWGQILRLKKKKTIKLYENTS